MSLRNNGKTLLWALRSPCNLRCRYCYFGHEDEKPDTDNNSCRLSHNSKNDIDTEDISAFISTFGESDVRRVFIAGGEPLLWPDTMKVIRDLKDFGCEVVVCTNGVPLVNLEMCHQLIDLGVDAISISLDSYDPEYNDYWRVDKSGKGWNGVVLGIQQLLQVRNSRADTKPKIGIYSVLTKLNIHHTEKTYDFVCELGLDYFIIQPVALDSKHSLYEKLSLNGDHCEYLKSIYENMLKKESKVKLCDDQYFQMLLLTLKQNSVSRQECFAGESLFFIEPNGSVWDCPSAYTICNKQLDLTKSIINNTAYDLFSAGKDTGVKHPCNYFSCDCVNMWQLIKFDDIIVG